MQEIAEHFIGFYRDIFSHAFEWITELTTTYSGAFVFFAGLTFICLGALLVGNVIYWIRKI